MQALRGEEVQLVLILDLGTGWGWVVSIVLPSLCFTPREGTLRTHWIGGWVSLRASLDTEARGKILLPLPGIEPWFSGRPRDRSYDVFTYYLPPAGIALPYVRVLYFASRNCLSFTLTYASSLRHCRFPSRWTNRRTWFRAKNTFS
jgi:hypothetical protein